MSFIGRRIWLQRQGSDSPSFKTQGNFDTSISVSIRPAEGVGASPYCFVSAFLGSVRMETNCSSVSCKISFRTHRRCHPIVPIQPRAERCRSEGGTQQWQSSRKACGSLHEMTFSSLGTTPAKGREIRLRSATVSRGFRARKKFNYYESKQNSSGRPFQSLGKDL